MVLCWKDRETPWVMIRRGVSFFVWVMSYMDRLYMYILCINIPRIMNGVYVESDRRHAMM